MYRYCLIGLLFFSQFVQAQMYQWTDPESGTTQLSGKPPGWYRSAEGGPRVFVFNRGKIVDDTGIEISDEQRISLRTKAFVSAEADRIAAQKKALGAAKVKAAMERNSEEITGEGIDDEVLAEDSQIDPGEAMAMLDDEELVETDNNEDDVSIEKLKALILEWENMRTDEARSLLLQGVDEK